MKELFERVPCPDCEGSGESHCHRCEGSGYYFKLLSLAELAEENLKALAVLEKIKKYVEYTSPCKVENPIDDGRRLGFSGVRRLIETLESQAPVDDPALRDKENERKAEAWNALYKGITGRDLVHFNIDLADLEERMDKLLVQFGEVRSKEK